MRDRQLETISLILLYPVPPMEDPPPGDGQTYEWAVRFPDKVLRAAPIAGTAQNTPHDYLFGKALMEASRPTRASPRASTSRTQPGLFDR
ncbi:hypothetical protein [Pseudonocardia sp. T1-2H]|uniref:hypothetical protein n=1 Tax=Pseudonocardia sp. T1-2H TaxID=3128899 RepID=UPI00310193BB